MMENEVENFEEYEEDRNQEKVHPSSNCNVVMKNEQRFLMIHTLQSNENKMNIFKRVSLMNFP